MTPDEEFGDMADWVKRAYRKGEIDRAGEHLVLWWKSDKPTADDSVGNAYKIIENWRTSHNLPLVVFQRVLRQRATEIDPTAIVAKRLKRFSSVMNKLAREPQMKLSQMQDLGGCRAIVSDVPTVYRLYESYRISDPLFQPEWTVKCYDYIECPKPDGYRGIHVVGRYKAHREARKPWDGHRIEIQLRSKLQHAFATAVETATTFTRSPLKFGGGPGDWRRFFSLMGSVLAIREETPLIEGTPNNEKQLIGELRKTAKELKVRQRLRGWTRALRQLPRRNITDYKWLLIVLNTTDNTVKVTGYPDNKEAARAVAEIEKMKREDLDAVLVWVNSITELQDAYPNYYADTREFLKAMSIAFRFQGKFGREESESLGS